MADITPIVMPKWGLSMKEGTLTAWLVEEGAAITVGMPILEVETDKIANQVEAPDPGRLRRKVATEGQVLPVKALIGVMADDEVSEADVDAYIASWVAPALEDDSELASNLSKFVDVGGIRVRYVRHGPETGTPVLLIHGYGGDLDNWLFNIDAMAETMPLIALDLPGHGQSAIKLPGATIEAMAKFVREFLLAVDVRRAHLVGHSMGGAIAAQVALDDANMVESLSLIGSAGFDTQISRAYLEGFARAQSRRELKPVLDLLFANPSLVSRKMIDDVLRYKRLDGVETLLLSLCDGIAPGGHQMSLPGQKLTGSGLEKRLLVIWGRLDHVIPAEQARNAPAGATVEIMDQAGHMVQMEQSSDVNRAILRHVGRAD